MRILTILLGTLIAQKGSAAPAEPTDVWDLLRALPIDPTGGGYSHLGDDGVLRNFDSDLAVVSYLQLTPEQIQQYISRYPSSVQDHLHEVFDGVDGRDVTDVEALMNPGPDILPLLAPGQSVAPAVEIERLTKRACHDYLCSSHTLCWSYSCTNCGIVDKVIMSYCY
ncbi:hypothetical protein BDW60DRAFT_209392 [Aspergillus nidulans var. acristatus]